LLELIDGDGTRKPIEVLAAVTLERVESDARERFAHVATLTEVLSIEQPEYFFSYQPDYAFRKEPSLGMANLDVAIVWTAKEFNLQHSIRFVPVFKQWIHRIDLRFTPIPPQTARQTTLRRGSRH
jgi:hypothetical protein